MDLVFTTDDFARPDRYKAWQRAICDFYVHVDVNATQPDDYRGFIRESRYGDVVLTDILLSEQRIQRNSRHLSKLDKECYYLQLIYYGNLTVLQRSEAYRSNIARGAVFSASEQYELQCEGEVRSFYLELPRDEFAQRFPRERIPVAASINTTQGVGRIATGFCAMLANEDARLQPEEKERLGGQLMDLLALTLLSPYEDEPMADGSVQKARLRSVQQWIERHISDPGLTLEKIAAANAISLRYLHQLFRHCDMSVSEWIWDRRLQLCYEEIAKGSLQSITNIAFDKGFNSSAHFSRSFRDKYGVSPRDLRRVVQHQT